MTGEVKFLQGIWNTRQLIVFTMGFNVYLPRKLVDNSAVDFLSSVCISVVAPLDAEDSVIVETSAETEITLTVSVTSRICIFFYSVQ